MKCFQKIIVFLAISILLSFNAYAMKYEDYELVPSMPSTEKECDDRSFNGRWTWLNDEVCVRFQGSDNISIERLESRYNLGLANRWIEKKEGVWQIVNRYTYSGKWLQDVDGIWSFEFDDKTIPVGVTKIDDVLYAFNGFGELRSDYRYYRDFKTEADGLVKADSTEFQQWLTTQYVPDCTSHE